MVTDPLLWVDRTAILNIVLWTYSPALVTHATHTWGGRTQGLMQFKIFVKEK